MWVGISVRIKNLEDHEVVGVVVVNSEYYVLWEKGINKKAEVMRIRVGAFTNAGQHDRDNYTKSNQLQFGWHYTIYCRREGGVPSSFFFFGNFIVWIFRNLFIDSLSNWRRLLPFTLNSRVIMNGKRFRWRGPIICIVQRCSSSCPSRPPPMIAIFFPSWTDFEVDSSQFQWNWVEQKKANFYTMREFIPLLLGKGGGV